MGKFYYKLKPAFITKCIRPFYYKMGAAYKMGRLLQKEP